MNYEQFHFIQSKFKIPPELEPVPLRTIINIGFTKQW